jgi:hypothetical protein
MKVKFQSAFRSRDQAIGLLQSKKEFTAEYAEHAEHAEKNEQKNNA